MEIHPQPEDRDTLARSAVDAASGHRRQVGVRAVDAGNADLDDVLADMGRAGVGEQRADPGVRAVHAEIRPVADGWREVLRSLAESTRQAAHEHEWLADLLGGRPQLGPHALATGETVVAALDGVGMDAVMPVVAAVNAYVIGAVRREIAERRAERATGMDEKRWQASLGPYLEQTFATGRFPALATVVRDAAHLDADDTFRTGLDFLLDGIEARISG
ncbi:TetR/AcrR family transcriptional regulator C-terminal domain-containing protein [Streptomyces sp. NPDC026673]|uniref:TetR/AcrR family transcriptional regulator C-terminal domain-containing protein n=1 Tax=Streptomyces sp. NPDC026673 TaxID=3155724 RepID=UPI00340881E4